MKYKVTLKGKTYEVEVNQGEAMLLDEYEAYAPAPAAGPAPAAPAAVKNLPAAPGTAGEVKIYDTDPRDAAMIMAIVADKLQKPLNELRFVSIKEVK